MKRFSFLLLFFSLTAVLFFCGPAFGDASGKISAAAYLAGETITIEGDIESGQELYVTIAQKKTFAPKDTNGTHEVKRLKRMPRSPISTRTRPFLRFTMSLPRIPPPLAARARKDSAAHPYC